MSKVEEAEYSPESKGDELEAGDHPALAQLEEQVARARKLACVAGIEPVTALPDGTSLGKGWLWDATLVAAPDSPLAGGEYSVRLVADASWPGKQLQLQFTCVMVHSQVNDLGFPGSFFYDAIEEPAGVPELLQCAQRLLGGAVPEPSMSDEVVLRNWQNHPASCRCDMVPVSYEDLMKLSEEEIQGHLQRFKAMYDQYVKPRQQRSNIEYMANRLRAKLEYKPLHASLFDEATGPRDEWLAPTFLRALKANTPAAWREILKEEVAGVYSFDFLQPKYCDMIAEELAAFNANKSFWKNRPNSMNHYGIILNDMGLERMNTMIMQRWISPLARYLLPHVGGMSLDHHHVFSVEYATGEDLGLDMHVDDSEVTVNVNIDDGFSGAGLVFCGMHNKPDRRTQSLSYKHVKGRAVIHSGKHRHGAMEIESGRRKNLIIWCKSTMYRQSTAFRDIQVPGVEVRDPDIVCVSRTHDGDAEVWLGGKEEGEEAGDDI